jgi:hypothetical protein
MHVALHRAPAHHTYECYNEIDYHYRVIAVIAAYCARCSTFAAYSNELMHGER